MSSDLTPREVESLQLAAAGQRSQDIAELWGYKGLANGTAASHVRQVWRNAEEKLGADTITQAVGMAVRRGIIE